MVLLDKTVLIYGWVELLLSINNLNPNPNQYSNSQTFTMADLCHLRWRAAGGYHSGLFVRPEQESDRQQLSRDSDNN